MIKYTNTKVTFREIPDEISLCLNISNCQNKCKGCHSPELRKDVGEVLSIDKLEKMINNNQGISCICFMGVGNDIQAIEELINFIHFAHPKLKVGIYSGDDYFDYTLMNIVDYYKIGHYDSTLGPLDNPNTNQRLFKVINGNNPDEVLTDITYRFWNKF